MSEVAGKNSNELSEKEVESLTIEQIISDPKLREDAIQNARQIQKEMRGNWFTLDKMAKKCGFKEEHIANDILNLFCLMGLAYRKENAKHILVYKITFSPADRLIILNEALAEARENVLKIERQISKISNNNEA